MKQIKDYLCNLPFWGKLTDYERELLRNNAYLRRFEKGSYVFSPKDEDDFGMMVLLRGQIRAHMLSEDGREVTLFSLCDGSICVFSAASLFKQLTFRVFLLAERPCEALVINMALLEKLTQKNIYFRCFVYELIAERFSWVMGSMQWILFHGLEKRLAFFLVSEYDKYGKSVFHCTHEVIAKNISASRERVSKALKGFQEKGLILRSKGRIEMIDIAGLRALADPPDLFFKAPPCSFAGNS